MERHQTMPTDEGSTPAPVILKRLQQSSLRGQPLLPLLLSDPFYDIRGSSSRPQIERQSLSSVCGSASAFWEQTHSLAKPTSFINAKNLRTMRRLITSQWAPRVRTASELLKSMLASRRLLTTGFPQLDELLQGGIMTGEITEVFGPSAVGKTQLCHNVIASITSQTQPGDYMDTKEGATVLYLDTKGDFSACRLLQLLRSHISETLGAGSQLSIDTLASGCLQRVRRRLVPQLQQFTDALVETRQLVAFAISSLASPSCAELSKNDALTSDDARFYANLQLIVIDCIAAPFAPFISVFPGEATAYLVNVIAELKRLTADLGLGILVVNNLRYHGGTPQGSLGLLWSRTPHTSLYMVPVAPLPLRSSIRIARGKSADSRKTICELTFRR